MAKNDANIETPMIKQYNSIKKNYPDSIVLYQMGDFYEMLFEDAIQVAKVLDIVLTSRNKKNKKAIPMCGFPCGSINDYTRKLIKNNFKVVICNQVGDSLKDKGLFERKVVRIITPGMIIDDEMIDSNTNNFIISLNYDKKTFGLSHLDISTGSFYLTESISQTEILEEMSRINPREVLFPEKNKKKLTSLFFTSNFSNCFISSVKDSFYDYKNAEKILLNQFDVESINDIDCGNMLVGISAAGALINYIAETQKQKCKHLKKIKSYLLNNFLSIDMKSCSNLEIFQEIQTKLKKNTLIGVMDKTITSMGGRLLNKWIRYPLLNKENILKRQDAVLEALINRENREKIRKNLKFIYDLERISTKLSFKNINVHDLIFLKKSIEALPYLFELISNFKSKQFVFSKNLKPLYNIADLISRSIREDAPSGINEGGVISEYFNSELDEYLKIKNNGKSWINNLVKKERKKTNISSLKINHNKLLGYYIEVSKVHINSIPNYYKCKQTLLNSQRYTINALKEIEFKIINAKINSIDLEISIFNKIILEIRKKTKKLQELADYIARIDCILNLGLIADENEYCRPEINTSGILEIIDGRHPVVEQLISGDRFVPNSIKMDNSNNQIIVITGPNMSGKSTILRQVALCIIMTHIGSFVPAKKVIIPITDKIFTRIGALDNLAAGQSTFLTEMKEVANITNNCTEKSFIIIDEIGRGTSNFEGLSIAWAIIEYFHNFKKVGIKSILATHYHELTKIEKFNYKIKNFSLRAEENDNEIIFMRKLIEGSTNKSYGIEVAKLAGIPISIIERAKEVLLKLKANNHKNKKISKKENIDDKLNLKTESKQNIFISDFKKINILQMNPIEALNCLNEFYLRAINLIKK